MTRLVTTSWSVRYEAICAVKNGFQGMIEVLDSLTLASENLQMRGGAQIISLLIENIYFMLHLFY